MTTCKKISLSIAVAAALTVAPSLLSVTPLGQWADIGIVHAAEKAEKKAVGQKKTTRVPAMRNRVYKHLALAQSTGDKEGVAAGLAKLDEVKGRISQLNRYERAMLWNFYGFMHYNNEDAASALEAFEKVIGEEAIPESLRLSTLRSIAQLNMMQEDYVKALKYLTQWQAGQKKDLSAGDHVLFAQNHYQIRQYQQALVSINQAIELTEAKDKLPKENWLVLQRAAYYETKQPLKVAETLEKMVRLYNKPEYWVQLAGMYGETEQEDKQLATMEAAWQAGYITKGTDMMTLAQLYLYNNVPYKAAEVLEQAMADNSIERDEKNLQLVSQAYLMAKNDDKAIVPLTQAAVMAKHGNFDAQLAEIYVNSEQWGKALQAAAIALQKGDLNNPGNVHMALGMANYNLEKFDKSLVALEKARLFKPTNNMASQWIKYVSTERLAGQQRGFL